MPTKEYSLQQNLILDKLKTYTSDQCLINSKPAKEINTCFNLQNKKDFNFDTYYSLDLSEILNYKILDSSQVLQVSKKQLLSHDEIFDEDNNFIKFIIRETYFNPHDIMQAKKLIVDFFFGINQRKDNTNYYDIQYCREEYIFTVLQSNDDIIEYLTNQWNQKYKPNIELQVSLAGLEGIVIRQSEFQIIEEFKSNIENIQDLLDLLSSAVDDLILNQF